MRVRRHPEGLTLIEAILLLVIISIVAVAAGVGLQAVVKVPAKTEDTMAINNTLVNVMEQMKAQLGVPTNGTTPATYCWPSTTTTTNYRITLPNTNFGGPFPYSPSAAILNAADGPQTVMSYSTPPPTPVGVPFLAINYKNYQLIVTVSKADPANPTNLSSASCKADFLQVSAQLAPLSGSTVGGVVQTMVTYVTKP